MRNVVHALMNARMCEQTFGHRTCTWTDRQMNGQMDRWMQTYVLKHACMHANTQMHALMNARMYDQTFGCKNKHADRQTDGWTDSHIRPHAWLHANTWTLACLHAHTMHSGTYAWTDRHTHTCSDCGKHPSTNMEVRSKKLEVRR